MDHTHRKVFEVVKTFGSLGFKLPSVEDIQKPQVVQMFMVFILFFNFYFGFLTKVDIFHNKCKSVEKNSKSFGEGERERELIKSYCTML